MRRAPRGFTMIFVLFGVLLLTVTATAYFSNASRTQSSSLEVSGQQMAVARAEWAAMRAILDIRANVSNPIGLAPRPAPDGVAACGAFNCLTRVEDRGNALALPAGGGMQWDYVIYKSDQLLGSSPDRYTIQANGYYGYTRTSQTFNSARIEVEIDVGSNATGTGGPGGNDSSGMF